MLINKIFKEIKKTSSNESKLSRDSIVILFFRWLSFYVTPLFILINISANAVTMLSLIFGLFSAILISLDCLILGYFIYFISVLFDHVDGNIARYKKEATFYGRFIDGFFGIIIVSSLHIAFAVFISKNSEYIYFHWVAVLIAVLTPMQHLFYDRYSTFVRWIKEEGYSVKTKPYIRTEMSWGIYIIDNLQKIILFIWPVLFYYNSYWELFLLFYFIFNFILQINTLYKHSISAKLYFNLSAKNHRT